MSYDAIGHDCPGDSCQRCADRAAQAEVEKKFPAVWDDPGGEAQDEGYLDRLGPQT